MNVSPLEVPEILEQILEELLHQTLWRTYGQRTNPRWVSSSKTKQRHRDLAFLRVARLWHQVGEPLLWRRGVWSDAQDPSIHQRLWKHWSHVRLLDFKFGNAVEPPPSSGVFTNVQAHHQPAMFEEASAAEPELARNTLETETEAVSSVVTPQHPITIYTAIDDLARALSQPSPMSPFSRPRPLVLNPCLLNAEIFQFSSKMKMPYLSPSKTWYLQRSKLTHLTLTGHFRLENLLVVIMSLVPELQYLDITQQQRSNNGNNEDELFLDMILRTCPKLTYLSIDSNMLGRFYIEEQQDLEKRNDDHHQLGGQSLWKRSSLDENEEAENEDETLAAEVSGSTEGGDDDRARVYRVNSWHSRFAFPAGVSSENVTEKRESNQSDWDSSVGANLRRSEGEKSGPTVSPSQSATPLEPPPPPPPPPPHTLRRVTMVEQNFLQLLKFCPHLQELDVYSAVHWSWNDTFLDAVKQACPLIKHMHLTTKFIVLHPQYRASQGIAISVQHLPPLLTQPTDGGQATTAPMQEDHEDAATLSWDPVGNLIKRYPDLQSYNAQYVCFQDQSLLTLEHHCKYLEKLDLMGCRKVTSQGLIRFLRAARCLRHLIAEKTELRIEDMIPRPNLRSHDSSCEKDQEEWWACEQLETLVVGIKNPGDPRDGLSTMTQDLQVECALDSQYYYQHGPSSSSSVNGHLFGAYHETRHGYGGHGPMQRPYNHIQFCTMILFQQLGRFHYLKRLELHGGRLDLGIKCMDPRDDASPPVQTQEFKKSGKGKGLKSPERLEYLLSPGHGQINGNQSQKDIHETVQTAPTSTSTSRTAAVFGKMDKGKGKEVDRDYRQRIDSLRDNDDAQPNKSDGSVRENVPDDKAGLLPLAGLTRLRSFGIFWSNFPQLREREIVWICENWKSLEWLSFGMVPKTEWDTIRSWGHVRRPEIAMIFEQGDP
ncbi:hypothetical protein BGZ94_010362 [Podila epigama]|nr:hypothetical protein BGZ94_010362 [Podila epigama]